MTNINKHVFKRAQERKAINKYSSHIEARVV